MLATVASLTSANRIKRRSAQHGIYPAVIQTPHSLSKDGCGYSVKFEDDSKDIIAQIALELKIRIRAFYQEIESDGQKKYIRL